MNYILTLLLSGLLFLSPDINKEKKTITITFESATQQYYEFAPENWEFETYLNNTKLMESASVTVDVSELDKLTFYVNGENSTEGFSFVGIKKGVIELNKVPIEKPTRVEIFGNNVVTVSVNELLAKQPSEIKIQVAAIEQNTENLNPTSRQISFNFSLSYN